MYILTEAYKNKLMSLAGVNTKTLTEASRVDFLKNDFIERVGRKYDKFLKFYSTGNWDSEKENDNFIKNIIWKEKIAFTNQTHPKNVLISRAGFIEIMTNHYFVELEKSDPSENKQYLSWLINIFLAGNLPTEDIYKAHDALISFSKNKEKLPVEQRNINSFTNLTSLFETVSQYDSVEMSASEKEKIVKLEGAEQVYDSPDWKIIIPKTQEAACLYGKNTKWCTASVDSFNRFDYYSKQAPLYILIDKRIKDDRNVMKKLQFHFKTNQFMNTLDNQIDVTKFFKQNLKLKDFFKKIGEITASFEIEHMLVTKEEGLKLLQSTKNKIDLIEKKDFKFLKKFFIEIGASKEFKQTILSDIEFIKIVFEKGLFEDLIESYKEMGVPSEGLNVIKSLPWLNKWITNTDTKNIEKFIYSVYDLCPDGMEFVKILLKRGGIIWNALLQPNKNKIAHYFNMLSSTKTLGKAGINLAKKMLKDQSVIDELKSKGVSDSSLALLNKFYNVLSECYQAHDYLRNILS